MRATSGGMERKKKPKVANLHVRVSEEDKAALQELANAANRSLTNYLEQLIRKAAAAKKQ
jgi:predicted HicB family RNase H-like nuclease